MNGWTDPVPSTCPLCGKEGLDEAFGVGRMTTPSEYKVLSMSICKTCAHWHAEGRGWSDYLIMDRSGNEYKLDEEAQTLLALQED